MKFTDGYWRLRPGVTAHYPAQAYDVEAGGDRLTIYAPARTIGQRGDTLNTALLTVELWSPLEDVIGVRLTHFSGRQSRGPRFELLQSQARAARAAADDEAAVLTSGRLAAGLFGRRPAADEQPGQGHGLPGGGRRGAVCVCAAWAGCGRAGLWAGRALWRVCKE